MGHSVVNYNQIDSDINKMDSIWIILFAVLAVNLVVLGIWFDRKNCQSCKSCIECPPQDDCPQQQPCTTTLADQPLAIGPRGTYIDNSTNLSGLPFVKLEMSFMFNDGAVLNGVLFAITGGTNTVVLRFTQPNASQNVYNLEYSRLEPSSTDYSKLAYSRSPTIPDARVRQLLVGWHTITLEIDVVRKSYRATIDDVKGTFNVDETMPDNTFNDAQQIYFGGRGNLTDPTDTSFEYINAAIKDVKVNDIPVRSLEYDVST